MVIIVHGGLSEKDFSASDALIRACEVARKTMEEKEAIDGVESAVKILEDDPRLNAGTGSFPNLLGEVEMSASVMKDDYSCGGVAAIKNIKNPISVARAVMERTRHVLLVGEGANLFAHLLGFEPYNPVAELTMRTLLESINEAEKDQNPIYNYYLEKAKEKLQETHWGTVGAVVKDEKGRLAAGTSTGGVKMQLPGRVGDTPLIGCGTFACPAGAVSMTGEGEEIMRWGLARRIGEGMEKLDVQEAVNKVMELAREKKIFCGAIAVNNQGKIGWGANEGVLPLAYWTKGMEKPFYMLTKGF
ncbi:MAG: isoaspartyl peptidase/L-asparaginase [Candidatus Atribacteria bacterium]|nr:isoaspartyl peptidase/L-asparaginase [Candidatus Atribacteria bacterium]